ncbi:MAG: DNA replication/repair protein RecF [Pseudomonadales bacterium]|jgi:DNA replication and repair protein RecF|nr:DNA replication/repair protein RecF [Pseudomonadales bacterium]MDP7146922.1 DNA replication/repair protein RecF [Pseudomonadales bacterium]MDP7360914.1 DNA replication/repair protein RecF [Pseudomonadales bacterium]HJN52077.1 DNA replication/repair protein RecF [Pseudomonadales bacterium]|tara:strand:+ start:3745 stop:4839 length:1095 start_codon:yes stop_codon:yes gene_type:complete
MTLSKIEIRNIRNLRSVSLKLTSNINLFYGNNGSGKTSLLEAVHLLGLGRSFRGPRLGPVINHASDDCTVFGQVDHASGSSRPLGIVRNRNGSREVHIGGEPVRQLSELAKVLPLQLINTDSIQLLTGPPENRRRFLNWGVFHVEPGFHEAWKMSQHCLKQRNVLLRDAKIDTTQLDLWSRELVKVGEAIDRYRDGYIASLNPLFQQQLSNLIEAEGFSLTYYRGWDGSSGLADVLATDVEMDAKRGYTLHGPQRAELRVLVDERDTVDVLSRGELKMVACAMMLAQAHLYEQLGSRDCLFLIDDLSSELDVEHRKDMCRLLEENHHQILVTNVERADVADYWDSTELAMFHVEHGEISPQEMR